MRPARMCASLGDGILVCTRGRERRLIFVPGKNSHGDVFASDLQEKSSSFSGKNRWKGVSMATIDGARDNRENLEEKDTETLKGDESRHGDMARPT